MSDVLKHLEALAIHSYYLNELDVGLRVCEKALRLPLTEAQENTFRSYRTWYTRRLDQYLPVTFHRLDIELEDPTWTRFNPSIVARPEGWLVNVRSSNYRLVDWRYVIPPEDQGVIRTKNYLVELTDDWKIVSQVQLQVDYPKSGYIVEGLEDIRLHPVDDRLFCSATLRDLAGWDSTCRIATGEVVNHQVKNLTLLASPSPAHEKNWMPLAGRFNQWIYSCHFGERVTLVSAIDGQWVLDPQAPTFPLAKGFRGGSQAVEVLPGQWLACVHEVAFNGGHRVYEHRFVLFDEQAHWKITAVSMPFVFTSPFLIEFAAGMALKGDRLVLSFGVMDECASVAEMDLEDVLRFVGVPTTRPFVGTRDSTSGIDEMALKDAVRQRLTEHWMPNDYFQLNERSLHHYQKKALILAELQPRTLLEIGVRCGYSLMAFQLACPDITFIGYDAMLDSDSSQCRTHLAKVVEACQISLVLTEVDTHQLKAIPDADVAHVDGDHSYEGALADLRLVAHIPVILADDCDNPDVAKAVQTFVAETQRTVKYIDDGLRIVGVIRKL